MKNFATAVIFCLTANFALAQISEAFNYQTIVRDALGNARINQSVSFRFSVIAGTISGSVVYSEEIAGVTNSLGVFDAAIGKGTPLTGSFNTIDWSTPKFLKVELAVPAGSSYTDMGTTQFLSVPCALYAARADIKIPYQQITGYSINSTLRDSVVFGIDSIIVAETGLYFVTFSASGLNPNDYIYPASSYDLGSAARVYNITTAQPVTDDIPFFQYYYDLGGSGNITRYVQSSSSTSGIYYFTSGDVLKAGAKVYAVGSPTGSWYLDKFSISMLKISHY